MWKVAVEEKKVEEVSQKTPKLQAVSPVKIETAVTAFQLQMKSIKKFETLIVQIPHPYMKTENNTVMCQYEGETLNG